MSSLKFLRALPKSGIRVGRQNTLLSIRTSVTLVGKLVPSLYVILISNFFTLFFFLFFYKPTHPCQLIYPPPVPYPFDLFLLLFMVLIVSLYSSIDTFVSFSFFSSLAETFFYTMYLIIAIPIGIGGGRF